MTKPRCSSMKQILLCLLIVTLTVHIFDNYCNIFLVVRVPFRNWVSNSSLVSDFVQASRFASWNDQYLESPRMNVACSTHSKRDNLTSCLSCLRPRVAGLENSFHEVIPQETIITNQSAEYFKIRPQIVQSLITDYLIVPRINSTKYYLVAVQASILDRRHERDTVRNTWGSVARTQTWPNRSINAHVKVIFVVARILTSDKDNSSSRNDSRLFEEIKSEADLHNDILYLDMIDSYENLTLKLLSAFRWIKDNCPCVKFVLKVDYDTFVNVPLLVDALLYFEDRFEYSILGKVYGIRTEVFRTGKWAVPESVYPLDDYSLYVSGCGYVLSYKVFSKIVDTAPYFPIFSIEDAFITGVMRRVIGCRLFAFPKMFTEFYDMYWNICCMLEDRKMLGMNVDGLQHTKIWATFFNDTCPNKGIKC